MEAIADIELAYQKSHGAKKSSVDLFKCKTKLPYTLNFSTMEQTRHGYGTKRKIRREPIPGGQSLQNLLQSPPFFASTTSSVAGTSSGHFAFSGGPGPATSMLMSGATGRGPPPSVRSATIDLTSTSGGDSAPDAKPLKKKGGKKEKTSPPLGRGGKNKSKMKAGSKIAL